jgi:hypothetical protein
MNLLAAPGCKSFGSYSSALLFVLVALLQIMTGCSDESASANATRLVRAMQLDQMMVISMQLPYRRGQVRNEGDEKQKQEGAPFYNCIYAIDGSLFTNLYAEVLAKELSIDEMRAAIRFLESEPGKKYVQRGMSSLLATTEKPQASGNAPAEISKDELAAINEFSNTTAGKKLSSQSILGQESVVRAAQAKWQESLNTCARNTQQKNK